jgi:hypothetical protein
LNQQRVQIYVILSSLTACGYIFSRVASKLTLLSVQILLSFDTGKENSQSLQKTAQALVPTANRTRGSGTQPLADIGWRYSPKRRYCPRSVLNFFNEPNQSTSDKEYQEMHDKCAK